MGLSKRIMAMMKLIITNSDLNIRAEKRYSPDLTVRQMKEKLEMVVGTNPDNMILQHKNQAGDIICTLQPDELKISKFDLENYSNIDVVDSQPNEGIVGTLTEVGNGGNVNIAKFEISDEQYKKRDNTFAKWKKNNLKGIYDKKAETEAKQCKTWEKVVSEQKMKLDDRCELVKGRHRGKIAFIGEINDKKAKGIWIGVHLDEPFGDCDGSRTCKVYFKCNDKHGQFVRPDALKLVISPSS